MFMKKNKIQYNIYNTFEEYFLSSEDKCTNILNYVSKYSSNEKKEKKEKKGKKRILTTQSV